MDEAIDRANLYAEAGADIVRVAVPREKDVDALRTIVAQAPIPIMNIAPSPVIQPAAGSA